MKKVELLAPAGNFEALKAAVNYGADAVYLGGTSFSARASANNFNHEELVEAVKYCHLRGVKVYLTINTLLNENELNNAYNEVLFAYENNVDALIIQDIGLFYLIREKLPDFALHASTQMHIHNLKGVKNAKKLGFKKVVLARESNLELIKKACKEDIEIECFVHGAICVSYSGQCLMSSATKNRSANKGMCAQCCRLKYELLDENINKVNTDTDYLLSPKDMFLLNDLSDLLDAGVSSLKIEGRLKSPVYVGLVTKIYREAIDAYYENKKYILSKDDYDNLLTVFNRGFTNAYLKDKKEDIFGNIRPNHMGIEIGKVIGFKNGECLIKLSNDINQFDGIRIIGKNDTGKILNTITVNKKYVSSAKKGEIISIKLNDYVYKDDIVVKTYDYKLENDLLNYKLKKRKIDLNLKFIEFENVEMVAKLDNLEFKKVFDIKCEKAINAPLSKEDLVNQINKFADSPFILDKVNVIIGNVFMAKSVINKIRRTFINEFEEFILNSFKREMIESYKIADLKNGEINNDLFVYDKPFVINADDKKNREIIGELGGIFDEVDNKTAYYTLNISNSYAYEFYKRLGFRRIILSTELSDRMIYDLIESYKKRNNILIKPYVLIRGKRTLMYIKRNPFEKYGINNKYKLSDRTNIYDLYLYDDHLEIIEREAFVNETIDMTKINKFVIVDECDEVN